MEPRSGDRGIQQRGADRNGFPALLSPRSAFYQIDNRPDRFRGSDSGRIPLRRRRWASPAALADKHRFTGYERDAETGIDYAMNRHYVSANGRFMQPDVLSGSIGNPQSLNRYSYSLNDPKNLSDPSGLQYVDGGPTGPPGGADPEFNYCTDSDPVYISDINEAVTVTAGDDQVTDQSTLPDDFSEIGPALGPNEQVTVTAGPDNSFISKQGGAVPPGAINIPLRCFGRILAAVNKRFKTHFTQADIVPSYGPHDGNFMNGGGANIVIHAENLPAAQFQAIQLGRYTNLLGILTGIGASLRIAGHGGLDPDAVFSKNNSGGVNSVTFTAHIDTSYAYNPIGLIIHGLVDLAHLFGPRNPCP